MSFTDQFQTYVEKEIPLVLRRPLRGNQMSPEMQSAIGRPFYPGRVLLGEMVSPQQWGEKFAQEGIPFMYQTQEGAFIAYAEDGTKTPISDIVGIFVREEYIPAFKARGGIIHSSELEKLLNRTRWQDNETSLYHEFSPSKAAEIMKELMEANIPYESEIRSKGFFGKVTTIRIKTEQAAYGLICHGASFENSGMLNKKYDEVRNPGDEGWIRSDGDRSR